MAKKQPTHCGIQPLLRSNIVLSLRLLTVKELLVGYSIDFNGLRNCIDVHHVGCLSLSELAESIPQVRNSCNDYNCWTIVSDIRQASYQLKDTEQYSAAQQLAEVFPHNTRILILHQNQIPLESIRLLEQSLSRHGIALKITSNEAGGFKWLES